MSILKVLMTYFFISWLSLFIDSHWDIKNINICEWQSNSEYLIQFICAMSGPKVHYLLSWTLKVTCFQIRLVQSNILFVIFIKKIFLNINLNSLYLDNINIIEYDSNDKLKILVIHDQKYRWLESCHFMHFMWIYFKFYQVAYLHAEIRYLFIKSEEWFWNEISFLIHTYSTK